MSTAITFSEIWKYPDDHAGITIPTVLGYGNRIVTATAKIDTGAEYCLFDRDYGERLGLTIEEGFPLSLETLTGTLDAFGHEVTIQTLGLSFQSVIYFSRYAGLPRNLLGRNGWLRNIRLAVIDYDNQVFLSNYEDA